ncbi:MAG: hypothetical protein GKR89_37520 [Candidatus Latescibacteria bacterium]|nr:hypothetical protein [Candidatus Latescibacterota bacterium]
MFKQSLEEPQVIDPTLSLEDAVAFVGAKTPVSHCADGCFCVLVPELRLYQAPAGSL